MSADARCKWSKEDRAIVLKRLKAGDSASQIAARLAGKSRNAVIGFVHRDKALEAIGFKRNRGDSSGVTRGSRKPRVKSNVVKFKVPKKRRQPPKPKPTPAKASKKPKLRVIVNTDKLVADWLERNGGPRKFENGFSTDYLHLKTYLGERGHVLNLYSNKPTLSGGRGRPRNVTWDEVWALADRYRVAEGKTPILRRRA